MDPCGVGIRHNPSSVPDSGRSGLVLNVADVTASRCLSSSTPCLKQEQHAGARRSSRCSRGRLTRPSSSSPSSPSLPPSSFSCCCRFLLFWCPRGSGRPPLPRPSGGLPAPSPALCLPVPPSPWRCRYSHQAASSSRAASVHCGWAPASRSGEVRPLDGLQGDGPRRLRPGGGHGGCRRSAPLLCCCGGPGTRPGCTSRPGRARLLRPHAFVRLLDLVAGAGARIGRRGW